MKKLLITLTLLTAASALALSPRDKKLFEAIYYEQDIEKARAALEQGANINAISDSFTTPLLGGIHFNSLSLVRFLIDNGANSNRLDPYLVEEYGNVNPHFMFVAEVLNQEILELLLEKTNPVNQYTLDYALCIAVSYATSSSYFDQDCDCKNVRGRMTKCTHGKPVPKCKPCMKAFITVLLEHGASPFAITTIYDYSPEEIAQGLVDPDDCTIAYELAKQSKDKALIKLLDKYKPGK